MSSPADNEGAGSVVVFSDVVDGYGAVLLIIAVEEGTITIVVAITVTVISWSPIVVIILTVGSVAVIVSFVVVLVDIIKIETIVLDDGAVAVVSENEFAGTVYSTHPALIWYRLRMNTLVYWFMDGN